jgi:hypothetical protein
MIYDTKSWYWDYIINTSLEQKKIDSAIEREQIKKEEQTRFKRRK